MHKSILEKLRSKPEKVKRGIALVVSAIIFCLIFVVWISSRNADTSPTVNETLSPLSGFVTIFQNFITDVKNIGQTPGYGNVETQGTATTTTVMPNIATSTQNIDTSGIVIIDSSTTTAK